MLIKNGKHTREHDLNVLEEKATRDPRAKKYLEYVHKQSRDPRLEDARKQLVEAHRRNDVNKSLEIEKYLKKNFR